MTDHKQLHAVPSVERRAGLSGTTYEQRRRLTAAQLIGLMGRLYVGHRDYVARPRSLLPMANVAGRQPCISCTDYSLLSQVRNILRWAAR